MRRGHRRPTWRRARSAADLRRPDAREIPEGTAGHIIHQYLGAGVDTTIASIGNIVALFGRHPEQFELVRKDPRSSSPPPSPRCSGSGCRCTPGARVTRDVEIDGATVPAGAQVAILFGAGNRDARHYENPDRFDVTATRSITSPSATARTAAPAGG